MLSYGTFKMQVEEELEGYLPDGRKPEFREVTKNNGVRLDGVTAPLPGTGTGGQVLPAVYLQDFYEEYLGGTSMQDVLREMAVILSGRPAEEIDPARMLDYAFLKDRLFLEACSLEANRESLREFPHMVRDELGLALVPRVNFGMGTSRIPDRLLDKLGISRPQLLRDALENSVSSMPYRLESMDAVIKELTGREPEIPEPVEMYVLTNPEKCYGASTVFYPGVMEKIGERLGGDFIILPSSIHEVLLLPYKPGPDFIQTYRTMKEMVETVNATGLAPEEVLSDEPYMYDSRRREIVTMQSYVRETAAVRNECIRAGFTPTQKLVSGIKDVRGITGENTDLKEIAEMAKRGQAGSEKLKEAVEEVAAECRAQQLARMQEPPVI